MRFEGRVWRHVPRAAHPLHVGFILKATGRWNRAGQYGCLYTPLTREGAIAECRKYRQRAGITVASRPRNLVSIEARIDSVVDLTDGRSSPVPPLSPYLTSDEEEDLEACRALADLVRSRGRSGLITPSAATKGLKNLVVYLDGPARAAELDVGPDREPLKL